MSNTNRELTEYITEKYDYKEKNVNADIINEATLARDGLEADLFEAKINGNLDRIYAHKMTYEITMLMNDEAKLINATNDNNYKDILNRSYNSLETLHESFSSFSETK